ncbi:MAG: hypothetical protein P9M14_10040 [Candidatus Alcyoniella australis]|nr:hypothetical protein [Candidatus Alcyoniella australis]
MLGWFNRFGALAALIVISSLICLGAYVEQGQAEPISQQRILPPEPVNFCDASQIVENALEGIKVDAGIKLGPLQVYPLRKRSLNQARDVISMDQALEKGWLQIAEYQGGNVSTLEVSNTGPKRVLLMAGEVVVGGRQNRIIRQDTLVPPKTSALAVPVYCGEQQRWTYGEKQDFGSGGWVANPSTRKAVVGKLSQSEVWTDIDRNLQDQSAAAPSRSVQELTGLEANAKLIEHYDRFIEPKLPAGTVGVAVSYRGKLIGLDVFGSPELCRALVSKIMRGYICQGWQDQRPKAVAQREIVKLLEMIPDAAFNFQPTTGEGCSATFAVAGMDGELLVNNNGLVHIATLD